jgi:Spy/CpxP family protein refolding chaperone
MKKMGATIKKTAVILAFAAMVPSLGFAFGGHWGGGKPKGPPQKAIDACAGMSEGDAVQFTTPRGDTVSGICREIGDGLIAVPEGGFPGRHRGTGPGKRIDRMAKKLDLTEAQQEQVKAILESEREKAEPLRQQLAETREKIRKAIEAEPFDEAAVRALAASQNETRVELVVSRARVRGQIFALLSPEQREQAMKLRPWGEGRHGHRPWM